MQVSERVVLVLVVVRVLVPVVIPPPVILPRVLVLVVVRVLVLVVVPPVVLPRVLVTRPATSVSKLLQLRRSLGKIYDWRLHSRRQMRLHPR